MPVSTLVGMAQRSCIRNLHGITDLADLPYEIVRPILKRITDPTQLKRIEDSSPQIADADSELWKEFIKRDIPKWGSKIIEPKNPRSWWKVYRKLIKEEQRLKEEQEARLMESLGGLERQKEANQIQIIHRVIPQKGGKGKAFVNGIANGNRSGWGASRAPTLGNARTGKDVLGAIKRQSAAAHQQRTGAGRPGIIPARSMLQSAKSQIRQAPKAMVMDHQRPAPNAALQAQARQFRQDSPPSNLPTRVFAPKSGLSKTDKALNAAVRAEREEKERRLRLLTAGGARPSPAAATSPTAGSPAKAISPVSEDDRGARSISLAVRAGEKRKLSPSPGPTMMKKPRKVDPFMAPRRRPG